MVHYSLDSRAKILRALREFLSLIGRERERERERGSGNKTEVKSVCTCVCVKGGVE